MNMSAALERLKDRNVTVSTSRGDVTGTLKVVGEDFIDVEYRATKSTLVPMVQICSVKEN